MPAQRPLHPHPQLCTKNFVLAHTSTHSDSHAIMSTYTQHPRAPDTLNPLLIRKSLILATQSREENPGSCLGHQMAEGASLALILHALNTLGEGPLVPASIPKLLENTAGRGHQTLPWCWAGTEQHTKESLARTAKALYIPSDPRSLSF